MSYDGYDDVRRVTQNFCEEIANLRKSYFDRLCSLCETTKSRVLQDYIAECEELWNKRITPLWRNEWDDWLHGSHSMLKAMQRYACGDEAEELALSEQRRLSSFIEDVRPIDFVSQFPAFTGVYTEDIHIDLMRMTSDFADTVEDLYRRLECTAEELGNENRTVAYYFPCLVREVFKVFLLVARTFVTNAQHRKSYISDEVCATKTPTPSKFSISFNPKTGYVEIQTARATKSLDLKGKSPQEIAQVVAEQVMSTELNDSTEKVHLNYDDFI